MADEEVSGEEQAAAAIKLSENVRKLIRDEISAVLTDDTFWNEFPSTVNKDYNRHHLVSRHQHILAQRIMVELSSDFMFAATVKQIIKTQMEKR
jgi:hypothetical protein